MNSRQPYRPLPPQIPADSLRGNPCDSRDPRRCVPPLKGLRETLTASVSYRASVPAGHAYCEVAPSHRALAPAADRQNRSFKALSGKGSAPATPPPFRHTPGQSRPRHTATVWRNPGRHPHRDGTFTFSAKEKDSETGLSYFGSRYYSSDLSIWLSVDPMAHKYPSLSPYVYCANNPVRLVDPNGDSIINPYQRLIDECNTAIDELEKGIKEQKYNYPDLAQAALEAIEHELEEYTEYLPMADLAISALKEDDKFYNALNHLEDELGNPIDIFIYINPNLRSEKGRDGECIEDVFLFDNRFCGFRDNKVDMILSGCDIGITACHEGGHIENDVTGYTKQRNWIISNGHANDPNYSGHEPGNPSGEKAQQRENEYKRRH